MPYIISRQAWLRMINAPQIEADGIAADLLSHCKLDTFAMVEIFRFLAKLVGFDVRRHKKEGRTNK